MKDAEHRIGIVPIDELLAARAALVKEAAPLWAKYGVGEVWNHLRKSTLSTLAMMYRAKAAEANEKITDGKCDDLAHSDETYQAFLATALSERERLFLLQNEIDGINHQIMRANVVASYAKGELAL